MKITQVAVIGLGRFGTTVATSTFSGGGHSGGGLFINTEDHARFGLLFLRQGKWNESQLISQDWIDEATQSSPAQKSYGYMWWLNKEDGEGYWRGVPENVYYGAGFGGNYIVVIPDNKIVIVARWMGIETI